MPKAKTKRSSTTNSGGVGPVEKQPCLPVCIIHADGIKDPGKMTLITDLSDPNRRFKDICTISK